MVIKYFIRLFLLALLLNNASFAENHVGQMRYFPELKGNRISTISKIDSEHVLALTFRGILLEWKGTVWRQFTPQPPQSMGGNLIAFSSSNIWRFFQEEAHIYLTKCLHYDGKMWREVKLSQPYHIGAYSFLDSARFWAGGGWGSLIYYDDKHSKNIRTPVGEGIEWIKAFSQDSAAVLISINENPKRMCLYIYASGNWKPILHWDKQFTMVRFFTPDSFIYLSEGSFLYKYGAAGAQVLDTLGEKFLTYHNISEGALYYNADNWIWRYKYPRKEKLFKLRSVVRILEIQKDNYLLSEKEGDLLYYGDKGYGAPLKKEKQYFIRNDIVNSSISRQIGLATYRNINNKSEIYFCSPELENWFLSIVDVNDDFTIFYKNLISERGLLGRYFGHVSINDLWDGSLIFADLDNDGDRDAILTSLRGSTRLYENMGDDRFENVTRIYDFNLTGRLQEVSVSDINNDGWLDIIAGEEIGPLSVLLNRGYWRFKDVTSRMGFPDSLKGYKTALADMNNDGFPDLFLFGNYDRVRYFENKGQKEMPCFIEKTDASPDLTTRFDFFTRSIAFADYDIDGDLDFLLVNRKSPLKLFENVGGKYFKDVSSSKGFNQSFLCYGAAWGDWDMDGRQDIFLTTLGKNYIFWNKKGSYFSIDSLFIPNNKLEYSTACLAEDLDNNGVLDIVVANYEIGSSYFLYNALKDSAYIKIDLKAQKNTSAIGAHIELYESGHLGEKEYLRGFQEIRNQNGYCSGTLPQAYFTVSPEHSYTAQIYFPSGKIIKKKGLLVNSTYHFNEPVTINEKLDSQLNILISFLLNVRYHKILLQFLIILMIFVMVNYFIYKYTIWQKHHLLFYNAFIVTIYSILSLYFLRALSWSHFLIPAYVGLIFGALLFWMINRYTKLQYREEREFELFDLMRQFHHSHVGMNAINHLIFYASNFEEKKFEDDYKFEVDFYLNNTYPMLKKISFLAPKLLKNRKIINRFITHHSKIFKTLKIREGIKTSKTLKNNLTALKKDLAEIRGAVDRIFTAGLLICIAEVLHKFNNFSNISIVNQTGLSEILIVIKHEDLVQVLDNILQNAFEAMRTKKDKKITLTIEHSDPEHIHLFIRDYGTGISKVNLPKIFEEHFSTKKSSGLGLFHARQILSRYGSEIIVHEAPSENGTIFELIFRNYKNEKA